MSHPAEIPYGTRPRAVLPQAQMRAALRGDELRLHFHHIISLETGTVSGVEALLRWEHPQGGTLLPDDFLPAVAHTPVMHEITRWVVRAALDAVRAWPDWSVSVNISAVDATHAALVPDVLEALQEAGVAPERLILELTEQAMVQSLDTAVSLLGALRTRGVELSLDDFGTGYSSLLYLRDLPITELKIDRTFLAGVPANTENLAIVASVAQLGRAVGVRVVAEGIETLDQVRAAQEAGCTAAQGYLWGEPAPAARVDTRPSVALPGVTPSEPPREPARRTHTARRIQELLDQGASLHTIAAALNSEGLRTPKKTRWTAPSVAVVISGLRSEKPP